MRCIKIPELVKNLLVIYHTCICLAVSQVFGVSSGSSSTWTYQIENDIVHTMMGSNRHMAVLNMKSTLNAVALAV